MPFRAITVAKLQSILYPNKCNSLILQNIYEKAAFIPLRTDYN